MKQKGILRRVARQTVLNGSPVYIIGIYANSNPYLSSEYYLFIL